MPRVVVNGIREIRVDGRRFEEESRFNDLLAWIDDREDDGMMA